MNYFRWYTASIASSVNSILGECGTGLVAKSRRHFQSICREFPRIRPSTAYSLLPSYRSLTLWNGNQGNCPFASGSLAAATNVVKRGVKQIIKKNNFHGMYFFVKSMKLPLFKDLQPCVVYSICLKHFLVVI
ncbi:hypothetical protein EGR_00653 [Echinococcus granulosus]|uniref:Uncharacterized protein n=1 Tax=Echinococcus granulosus TaxID=6210 RepID=W6UTU1_ECHGR|nr:hypothetical protein EGR_00653 [Echinococcus granulosus]EUB64703.1 hypothetical protein EGR_00653 [Echinococcus granulosus]